jgi:Ca2+-dependent lipid-binding protein
VRIGTFSFPSLPDFDIAARPLKKVGWGSINVMEMPLLKSYGKQVKTLSSLLTLDQVMKSVSKVAGAFVRPSSYTMDLDRLLLGKEASLRTSAIGVLQVQLHGATDLPKADTVGK